MVDADDVAGVNRPSHAADPPVIASSAKRVPVVERISPALSGFAERVRWNAGDDFRREIFLQSKQAGVGPHVGAVVAHEDRDIAYDTNAAVRAVLTQRTP